MRFVIAILLLTGFIRNSDEDDSTTARTSYGDVCPCYKPPGSDQCLQYQVQYAAVTVEEVILNFVDTTTLDASKATNILGLEPAYKKITGLLSSTLKCDTADCWACKKGITQRLLTSLTGTTTSLIGGLTANLLGVNHTVTQLLQSLQAVPSSLLNGTTVNQSLPAVCKFLDDNVVTTTKRPSYLGQSLEGFRSFRDRYKHDHPGKDPWSGRPRAKRQNDPSTLGTTTALKCDYKRGQLTDGQSNYCGLCNYCWSIRTLPDNYFPRYINERSCDQSDLKCLSGYGTCREIYRSIDVLYNTGTSDAPRWEQYSINTPVSCDCQVQKDSAMYSFISS